MQSYWLGESGSGLHVILFHQSRRTIAHSLIRFTTRYKPRPIAAGFRQ